MQSFFKWFAETQDPSKPWLILGKGPSFALRTSEDLNRYHLLSLNHVVREQPVHVAHVIDIDVIEACEDALERNAKLLVMPWYPHARNLPGRQTLDEVARETPLLRRLNDEGRLLWYDLSTSAVRHGNGPIVQATYFSAEAALSLLALAGVRQVRSLGVDGGSEYSGAFDDLRESTLLANGRPSFDLQFQGFARTILHTGVDFAPLDLAAPARVYVAHAPDEAVPTAVLLHSIRRHCSLTVELVSQADGSGEPTPDGPAVLLSPRSQVQSDLRPLFRALSPLEVLVPDAASGPPGLAVVGAGLSSAIPALASLIRRGAPIEELAAVVGGRLRAALSGSWNPAAPSRHAGEQLVLYYPPGHEPWTSRAHRLGHVWVRDLLDAVARGFVQVESIAEEVRRGHVRPSLLYQVEHELHEPLLLPRRARLLDRGFTGTGGGSPVILPAVRNWRGLSQAVARQLRRRLRLLRARASSLNSSAPPQTNPVARR